MQFGDHPTATLMSIAVDRAAETYGKVAWDLDLPISDVKEDSRKLLQDVYVNYGTMGGTRKEVDRMTRVKLSDTNYSGKHPKHDAES